MKVIFLDIDGVLNTAETHKQIEKLEKETGISPIEIDEFRVVYLKQIIDATDAKVVLSSSWAKYFEKINNKLMPIHEKGFILQTILNKHGIELYDKLLYSHKVIREDLIDIWLNQHTDVESFVIIDDETTELMKFVNKQLIKTSYLEDGVMLTNMYDYMGLCEEHIGAAINILKKEKTKKKSL